MSWSKKILRDAPLEMWRGGRTFWKGMLFFSQPAGVRDFFFQPSNLCTIFFSKMTMPFFGLVLLGLFQPLQQNTFVLTIFISLRLSIVKQWTVPFNCTCTFSVPSLCPWKPLNIGILWSKYLIYRTQGFNKLWGRGGERVDRGYM